MIDTETKRRSVQAYTRGLMRPLADGTIDVGDRACVAWLYAGLTYGPAVAGGGLSIGTSLGSSSGISIGSGLSRGSNLSIFAGLLGWKGRYDYACV